jgi:hypothetical protein
MAGLSPIHFQMYIIERSNGGDDKILTLTDLLVNIEKLTTQPRFGGFGDNEAASDFVFVARN